MLSPVSTCPVCFSTWIQPSPFYPVCLWYLRHNCTWLWYVLSPSCPINVGDKGPFPRLIGSSLPGADANMPQATIFMPEAPSHIWGWPRSVIPRPNPMKTYIRLWQKLFFIVFSLTEIILKYWYPSENLYSPINSNEHDLNISRKLNCSLDKFSLP